MKINGYYINLEHRKDRNKHFIDNIKKYDFFSEIKRYGAVYNKDCGAIGCVKSHINVLELCLQQNDNYYLIMEDDFSIFHENNLRKFIDSFTNIKNENWDIITLTPCGTTINSDIIKDYCRIKNNLATSGYIIKKDKINILLDNFKESLNLLIETGDVKRYILDMHWFKIQDELRFYYFKDLFGTQLNGFSDIKNDYTSNRDKLFINNDCKKLLINEYLINLINKPYDDINNFKLAYEYEELGQTGAALSYYLRCAEYTNNDDLSYECFLRMSKCLSKQGDREFKELTCLEHAISIRPDRPEAYYIMSLYHSFRGNWLKSYMYACIGLQNIDLLNNNENKLMKDIGYFDKYQLLFQKAYSGYNKGKLKESKMIYYDLLKSDINDNYRRLIKSNLSNYPKINDIKSDFNFSKLDIVLQGKYNDNVLLIAEHYLELDFVNNIIISCWEDDVIQNINNERIKIVKNKIPSNPGTGQRNLQIVSSLGGIKESETEFIVKIRNDQRYTHDSMINMYNFYEEYKERKLRFYYEEQKPRNRICVSGNFSEYSFHPRDHLFWGNREDLIDLFSLPLEQGKITDKIKFVVPEDYSLYYEYFIRTETYIGAHYLSNFDREINYYLLDPKKYLYDNSEKYSETRNLSDKLTSQVFKSFPREGIDLEWYKYKWNTYPYEDQRNIFGERWHEDGL